MVLVPVLGVTSHDMVQLDALPVLKPGAWGLWTWALESGAWRPGGFPGTRALKDNMPNQKRHGMGGARATNKTTTQKRHAHTEALGSWGLELEGRSEEHTSELQSQAYYVCRLRLEKKNSTPDLFPFRSSLTNHCFPHISSALDNMIPPYQPTS